jgi:hypothetical protein
MIDAQFLSFVAQRRWDLYGPVHKGLRLAHAQLVTRLGAADPLASQRRLLADLGAHLAMAASHLAHEDEVIHAALERARPGATAALADDHQRHHARLERLHGLIDTLERCPREARPAYWRSLYLAFADFVAADLEHMAREETVAWPQLCAAFSDDELAALEMQVIGGLSPRLLIDFMRIMLPAMSPDERAWLLSGMKANARPEAYREVIAQAAAPTLAPEDLDHLARLGLAA